MSIFVWTLVITWLLAGCCAVTARAETETEAVGMVLGHDTVQIQATAQTPTPRPPWVPAYSSDDWRTEMRIYLAPVDSRKLLLMAEAAEAENKFDFRFQVRRWGGTAASKHAIYSLVFIF
ncbi:hypothetical protein F6V30_14410 [Oryzomonas sagensis]|uniref:Secreted protein n=1 Tax=Oryzomonas sagensis TaxID=2603857 RepID=A0ABQ6TLG1_9BACT|nr:hypothetical protein [Oryzomonas sagensis]KAB0669026.1 hypothetical protein F6V30_14410 [Oryzomonas sagensis]